MFFSSVLKTAELFGVRSHEGQTDEPFPRWNKQLCPIGREETEATPETGTRLAGTWKQDGGWWLRHGAVHSVELQRTVPQENSQASRNSISQ